MKYLRLFLGFLEGIFFGKFKGAGDTPVVAGLDAIVKLAGKQVAYATNVSFDDDFELQGIRTLGYHGDRDFKSMGYTANVTVGTFVLQGSVDDALPTPDRTTILKSGLVDFEIIDLITGKTLYILQGCKCASRDIAFDSGSLTQKNTRWRAKNVKMVDAS